MPPRSFGFGKLLAVEGKSQEAIAALEPVPNLLQAKLATELASLYLEARQYPAASDLLRSLIAQNPNDAQLYLKYGSALECITKYPEAQTVLLKAVQLFNPNLVGAYSDIRVCHRTKIKTTN